MNKETIERFREKLLDMTASELMDNDIRKELHELYLSVGDLCTLMKIPQGFNIGSYHKIQSKKYAHKKNKLKNEVLEK